MCLQIITAQFTFNFDARVTKSYSISTFLQQFYLQPLCPHGRNMPKRSCTRKLSVCCLFIFMLFAFPFSKYILLIVKTKHKYFYKPLPSGIHLLCHFNYSYTWLNSRFFVLCLVCKYLFAVMRLILSETGKYYMHLFLGLV